MNISPFRYFFYNFPNKSIFIILLIFLSGFLEAFSFAAVLPLISVLFDDSISNENGIIFEYINNFINLVGIDYTLLNILMIITVGFFLKSLLSFIAMQQTGYVCTEAETLLRKNLVM